jgi:RNA-directed DNA polymerase
MVSDPHVTPLLANCYLHILDRIWQRQHLKGKLQAHLVRYADDFVVMCRKDVEEPLKVVRHVLERLGLSLNEAKTRIVDATEASFDFLGFTIQMSRGARTGKPYPNVRPADKSLKKIKAKLTELTGRNLTNIPLGDIVGNVNRSLRGWANYFHYRNSSLVMSKARNHAENRLRTHLMKRHKVKDRGCGLGRFPSADLYGRYGLYKVPAVAGWRAAHALT